MSKKKPLPQRTQRNAAKSAERKLNFSKEEHCLPAIGFLVLSAYSAAFLRGLGG